MKLAKAFGLLHLAQAQSEAHRSAATDRQLSFERACLWYLNQALDAIVDALREHHGLRGHGDESQTIKELASRNLPSAAADECLAWPNWSACRKALSPDPGGQQMIQSIDDDKLRIQTGRAEGFASWVKELDALCSQLQIAYAEF